MKVSLITTVKDAAPYVAAFLDSVRSQTRRPDEVIVVDGGSSDGTLQILRQASGITLIEEPGANISRGRNVAVRAAAHTVIAVSDADCVLAPDWLALLLEAIEGGADVAMGFYRPIVNGFFEACLASATLPDPEELREDRFMPSARSVMFQRVALERVGGYPEWLDVGEDMYVNHRWREMGAKMRLVRDAVAYWPLRTSLDDVWRQYFRYARGDALAGMYPERNAIRFIVYGGSLALLAVRRGRPSAAVPIAIAGALYASKRLKRAFRRLRSNADRARAVVVVPALMAFIDLAKMAGYGSGRLERARDSGSARLHDRS